MQDARFKDKYASAQKPGLFINASIPSSTSHLVVWIIIMPNWKSPAELQLEGGIFAKFMHALIGLYAYVAFIALGFTLPQLQLTSDTNSSFPWTLIGSF